MTLQEKNVVGDAYSSVVASTDNNNSTARSSLTQFQNQSYLRECVSEALGTFVLCLLGLGVVAQTVLSNGAAGNWTTIAIGWGIAVTAGIYASAPNSSSHLNPAVTLSLAVFKQYEWRKVPGVIASQLFGAYFAALTIYVLYVAHLPHNNGDKYQYGLIFVTSPKTPMFYAFLNEFIASAVLLAGIHVVVAVNPRNSTEFIVPPSAHPSLIGLLVTSIGISLGYQTGYAINPVRDFGPRLMLATVLVGQNNPFAWHSSYFWVPIVAPVAGGIFGTMIYNVMIKKQQQLH